MQSILVPTDGSEAAEKAFGVALDLALQHGATIKVLHVLLRNKEPGELLRLPEVSVAGQEVVRELKRLEEMPVAPPSVEQIMTNPDAVLRPASELVLRMIGAHVLKRASARATERGLDIELLELADSAPAHAIVASAAAEGADTIVMGMRGLSLSDMAIIGSVSQEVCRTAACTCIVVH